MHLSERVGAGRHTLSQVQHQLVRLSTHFWTAPCRCRRSARPGVQIPKSLAEHPNNLCSTGTQEAPPQPAVTRRALLTAAGYVQLAAAAATAAPPAAHAAPAQAARPFCGVVNVPPPWSYSVDWQEGTVDYAGYKTWYRMLGKPPPKARKARSFQPNNEVPKLPLLVLHGGPGTPSRYLESLELLGITNRRLVFYDQIGCGQSRRASSGKGPGLSRINPQLFMGEIDAIREALSLERMHVVGHGWGGLLALAYLLSPSEGSPASSSSGSKPAAASWKGIASLTLLATPPSWQALVQDRRDKAESLGPEAWSALQLENGSPACLEALQQYERAFVYCKQPVEPGCLEVARLGTSPSISKAMTGGKLFQAGGVLADWQLPEGQSGLLAGLPTLVARGSNEEISPSSTHMLLSGVLRDASTQLLELQGAGSMVHIDQHEALLEAMEAHMAAQDAAVAAA